MTKKYFMLLVMVLALLNARVLVVYAADPETVAVIKTIVNTLDLDSGTVENKFPHGLCAVPEKIRFPELSSYEITRSPRAPENGPGKLIVVYSMPTRASPFSSWQVI